MSRWAVMTTELFTELRRRWRDSSGCLLAMLVLAALLLWMTFRYFSATPVLSLGGGFYLHEFEGGNYYILNGRFDDTVGGAMDGIVRAIDDFDGIIVADVDRLYGGDPDGWYVLDTHTGNVRGPLALEHIKTTLGFTPIAPTPPAVYWDNHSWWRRW